MIYLRGLSENIIISKKKDFKKLPLKSGQHFTYYTKAIPSKKIMTRVSKISFKDGSMRICAFRITTYRKRDLRGNNKCFYVYLAEKGGFNLGLSDLGVMIRKPSLLEWLLWFLEINFFGL